MIKEISYSISELEKETQVNRRTIYYYTMEKLLPPPIGAGMAARYTEEHYLRLLLINQMQKSHLRLSGIKEVFNAINVDEMRVLLEKSKTGNAKWSLFDIGSWLHGSEKQPDKSTPGQTTSKKKNYSLVINEESIKKKSVKEGDSLLGYLKRQPKGAQASWRRIEIIEGLEVNIRSDIEKKHGSLLLQLLEQFKRNI